MIIFKHSIEFSEWLQQQRGAGKKIGFVPTMGALHDGHISLIQQCKAHNDIVISSIFINPTQFNNVADFEKYPVSIEQDIHLLYNGGCDGVFIPSVETMYPEDEEKQHFDLGYLEQILEGKFRPGHFQGVCQIVKKLLLITQPDQLFLGQKDFQQCMVIKRLLEIMQSTTALVIAPTIREQDGLAMSSRNRRLNEQQRSKAPAIYNTLEFIKENYTKIDLQDLKSFASEKLSDAGLKVEYVEVANAADLSIQDSYDADSSVVALVAAYLDEIRLIDNMLVR